MNSQAYRLLPALIKRFFIGWLFVAGVGSPAFSKDAATPNNFSQRIILLRRKLHEEPELGNREFKTMRTIATTLRRFDGLSVREHVAKTGVVAILTGRYPGPTIAVRTPIDAYPIQEIQNKSYASKVPNVSHACGHDAMTAIVIGVAELLSARRNELFGTVEFIFQPAEEGTPDGETGGASLMISEGALKNVASIIAFHVDADLPTGQIGIQEHAVYAGDDDFEIKIEGTSAHGATPWKGVDSLAVAAQVVQGLQMIASRQTDILDPVVITVGTLKSGMRNNALAGEALLTGTLRSYTREARERSRESMQRIVTHIPAAFNAKGSLHFVDETPPTLNDPSLVKQLRPMLEDLLGASHVKILQPLPFADDFAFMADKVPSFYYQLGIRNEKAGITVGTHTATFDVDEAVIPLAAQWTAQMVQQLLKHQGGLLRKE